MSEEVLEAGRRRVERLLFALALLVYGWSFDRDPGPGATAHVDQASAIALEGTLWIDRFVVTGPARAEANTVDWGRGRDGHYVSAKAPGMALLAAPVVAVLGRVERALGADPLADAWVLRNAAILNWLVNAPIAAAGLVLLLRAGRRWGLGERTALLGVAAVGFGTGVYAFASVFYAHVVAGVAMAAGAVMAVEAARGSSAVWKQDGSWLARLSGLLLGAAVLVDYVAALGVLLVGAYLLLRRPRAVPAFVLGGLAPLAVFLAFHALAYGTPFTTAYAHQNPAFTTGYALQDDAVFGLPPLRRVLDLTVLPRRGLFVFSPVLLLAAPGAWLALRSRDPRLRAVGVLAPLTLACWLGANASFGGWWGGATTGPRYVVPALPLLAPLVGLGWSRLPHLGWALFAISAGTYASITSVSILAHERAAVPLLDPVLVSLAHGALGRDNLGRALLGLPGLLSLAPLLFGAGALAALLARAVARVARAEAAAAPAGAPPSPSVA